MTPRSPRSPASGHPFRGPFASSFSPLKQSCSPGFCLGFLLLVTLHDFLGKFIPSWLMLLRSVSAQTSYLGLKHIRASYPVYVFTWLFHRCLRFNRSQTEFRVSPLCFLFCFVSSVASPSHQSNKPETWTILPLNYFLKPSMYFLPYYCLCPNSVSSYLAWCQDNFSNKQV